MLYFTGKTKEFHTGYMIFNSCQYGYHFVSSNHKTNCVFSLSVNIINNVQRCQRQSDRN